MKRQAGGPTHADAGNPYAHGYVSPFDGRMWDAEKFAWTEPTDTAVGVPVAQGRHPSPPRRPSRPPGRRPWAVRAAWWSLGIVTVLFGVGLVGTGVSSDPVMGGEWGGAIAPVFLWIFAVSCCAFVLPFVLGLVAVLAGHGSAWIPLVLSSLALSVLGFFFLLAFMASGS